MKFPYFYHHILGASTSFWIHEAGISYLCKLHVMLTAHAPLSWHGSSSQVNSKLRAFLFSLKICAYQILFCTAQKFEASKNLNKMGKKIWDPVKPLPFPLGMGGKYSLLIITHLPLKTFPILIVAWARPSMETSSISCNMLFLLELPTVGPRFY